VVHVVELLKARLERHVCIEVVNNRCEHAEHVVVDRSRRQSELVHASKGQGWIIGVVYIQLRR
jgi:hypothetical protein